MKTIHRGRWSAAAVLLAALAATAVATAAPAMKQATLAAMTSGLDNPRGLGAGVPVSAVAAATTPTPFELVFDGAHVPLAASPNGLGHAGTFTASAPLCPAGKAADQRVFVAQQTVSSMRVYTCDDGSGTFTVQVDNLPAEHVLGGTGTWRVTGGTSGYAKLRGNGTWNTLSVQGDVTNLASLTFSTKTDGTAFLDEVAPAAHFSKASAQKLARPKGAYLIRAVFFARDDDGTGATYRLKARFGSRTLASKTGQTALKAVSVSLTIRPPKGAHTIRLELTATDAVGNISTVERSLKLPA